jgi:hypothetical protein
LPALAAVASAIDWFGVVIMGAPEMEASAPPMIPVVFFLSTASISF